MSLCLTDREHFNSQWWSMTDSVLQNLSKMKEIGVDLVTLLVKVFLQRAIEKSTDDKLLSISQQLFSKKLFLPQPEAQPFYVQFIVTIASPRMEFAFQNIIFDLLSGDPIVPERVIIGVKAFEKIILAIEDSKKKEKRKPRRSLSGGEATISLYVPFFPGIEAYLPTFNGYLSHLVAALDSAFGTFLSTQSKTLPELLKTTSLGMQGIDLLCACLQVIPSAFPIKLSGASVAGMMCRYLIHLEQRLRDESSEVLSRLLLFRPDLRPIIFDELSNSILTLHERHYKSIFILLTKVK